MLLMMMIKIRKIFIITIFVKNNKLTKGSGIIPGHITENIFLIYRQNIIRKIHTQREKT